MYAGERRRACLLLLVGRIKELGPDLVHALGQVVVAGEGRVDLDAEAAGAVRAADVVLERRRPVGAPRELEGRVRRGRGVSAIAAVGLQPLRALRVVVQQIAMTHQRRHEERQQRRDVHDALKTTHACGGLGGLDPLRVLNTLAR